jgi:hypothetical protein
VQKCPEAEIQEMQTVERSRSSNLDIFLHIVAINTLHALQECHIPTECMLVYTNSAPVRGGLSLEIETAADEDDDATAMDGGVATG